MLWTKKDDQFLQGNYQKLSMSELADRLGRTKMAVKKHAQKLGIRKKIDPYPFFENWTEESAYVIGFFAADGTVSVMSPNYAHFGLAQKDRGILDKIHCLVRAGSIYQVRSTGLYIYQFGSMDVYCFLCDVFRQDVQRKSKILSWPAIPRKHVRHFIRGVFDGDGSFSWYKSTGAPYAGIASGSKRFSEGLENELLSVGIRCGTTHNCNDLYIVQCSAHNTVLLAHWLYDDCRIALNRKKRLADRVICWGRKVQ